MNMPLVSMNRRRRIGGAATPVFSPSALFALAEPGVWYDPSDLTTLFQDTAGTLPVTTPGQTVALALDKSKGLVLGSELVTSAWVNSGSLPFNTFSAFGGGFSATKSVSGTQQQAYAGSFPITAGSIYLFEATVASNTIPSVFFDLSTATTGRSNQLGLATGPSTVRVYFTATSTQASANLRLITASASTGSISVSSVSLRELPGFHATQATLASRPTYGIVPLGGRRNLLTRTEEFNDAVWTAKDATVAANGSTAPDGTATADVIVENTVNTTHFVAQNASFVTGQTYTATVYLKSRERSISYLGIDSGALGTENGYAFFNVGTGATGSTSSAGGWTVSSPLITPVGTSGWYRCSVTVTVDSTVTGRIVCGPTTANGTFAYAGTTGSGILIWGAQLETGSSVTAYQRVGSAFDVTEAGVASLSYLSFDGVDDFLITPTITPGIDKAQVFAGVRKLSDTDGMVAEFGNASAFINGTFTLSATAAQGYLFGSAGTTRTTVSPTGFAAPRTNVLTALGDISGDLATLRVNGTQAAQSTADQGTGNYLAYALYVGRRGGTSLPFNGQIYSLLVRFGTNLDAGTITSTETWVGGKTGVTL